MSSDARREDELDIAVIGMAGRFPGAPDLRTYWQNLRDGVESITMLSDSVLRAEGVDPQLIRDPRYVKACSMLDGVESFDAGLFGYSPKEAETIDPQARLFLECAWEALEGAGYPPLACPGSVGVYATESLGTYFMRHLRADLDLGTFALAGGNLPLIVGNNSDFLSTRLSYKLNLRGPSLTVQAACSSSLVAVHLARQALLSGECDVALAGGVSIYLPQRVGYLYDEGMILSPDGHCRPFDAAANGTVFGRGVGVVVLKPLANALADGDRIRAVLKGSAINNDGALKVGYTAPSVKGQAAVIAEALANAGVHPDTIGYIEAHGTGTRQGDPIEIAALTQVFRAHTQRTGFCALGTAKSNFGHLDVASGVAGFIKTVLMLEHGMLPPSLNFQSPNPQIDFASSPFFVNTRLTAWPRALTPRRAGVSAFGMGGTNAHVVLEEAPATEAGRLAPRPAYVLGLSAKDDTPLRELAGRWATALKPSTAYDLGDVCFTATSARSGLPRRAAWVVQTLDETVRALAAYGDGQAVSGTFEGVAKGRLPVAFLFPGQGAQYAGMGADLLAHEPAYRAAMDECEAALGTTLTPGVAAVLRGQRQPLTGTADAQPALFAVEYALAAVWRAWGIEPAWVLGHSVGEYAAACVAGALEVGDAMRLVAARGRLMEACAGGEMAAIFAPIEQVANAVASRPDAVTIAAVNGPEQVVITGTVSAVAAVVQELEAAGRRARPLKTGYGFHSPLMDPVLDELERVAATVKNRPPRPGWISTLTGTAVTSAVDATYWRRQARAAVQYEAAVQSLRAQGCAAFVEVGPGVTLTALGSRAGDGLWVASLRPGRDECRHMLEAAAALYSRGAELDWEHVAGGRRRRVELPGYPFQRKRYWVTPPVSTSRSAAATRAQGLEGVHPLLGARLHSPALTEVVFEGRLSVDSALFLSDHRVFGEVVLPATAYIEMALAAARHVFGTSAIQIEDLVIVDALRVPGEGARIVQFLVESSGSMSAPFRLVSRSDEAGASVTWQLHATGRVVRNPALAPSPRVPAAPDGLTEVAVEPQYARHTRTGLEYGPSFRGLTRLWVGDGEALGEVQSPHAVIGDDAAYLAHPALLDACLQVVAAIAAGAEVSESRVYLPLSMASFRLSGRLTPRLAARARVREARGAANSMLRADVCITDEQGVTVAEVTDLRLRPVTEEAFRRASGAASPEWFYEVVWTPDAMEAGETGGPRGGGLVGAVRPGLPDLAARHGLEGFRRFLSRLEALAASYVVQAFAQLGWQPRPGERVSATALAEMLGVVPPHRRLFGRLLEILTETQYLARRDGHWVVERALERESAGSAAALSAAFPESAAQVELTARCAESLAAVLRGACDPLQLLFPDGSFESVERLYREAPFTQFNNDVTRDIIASAVARFPLGRPLRVLEIGAGTGSTTEWILPIVPGDRTEYVFTDVSAAFTARARRTFARYPFVRYETLNIENSPRTQGFEGRRFDIVLAANVLHATRDLRQTLSHVRELLADDGLLVMLEGTRPLRWVDLTFGMTDGWWRFTDTALRPAYPLLSRPQWLELLTELGFVDAGAVPEPEHGEGDGWQTVIFGRAPSTARTSTGETWLIVGGDSEATRLAEHVRSAGDHPVVVSSLDDARPLPPSRHVIHLAALEMPPADTMTLDQLQAFEKRACGSLVTLVQALAKTTAGGPVRLWVVTRGAQPVEAGELAAAQAPLWGIGNVIAQEHPELRCTCVDLDPAVAPDEIERLHDAIRLDGPHDRVGFRGGRRHVARLARRPQPSLARRDANESAAHYQLEIGERGALDSLVRRAANRSAPGPGEVEIELRATGLNFKDVLNALGLYPGVAGPLGSEGAGVVARVGAGVTAWRCGDEVVGLVPQSFARYATTRAELVVAKPAALRFETAVTVPVAFLTAYYALVHLGRLSAGETVLIHSAAGGVGLAAVQIARRRGAEIYATAGTPEKRRYLESLGIRHVMTSRSTDFAGEVMSRTGGRGVDVVLNSLAGELAAASLSVLADCGRFLEIGKAAVLSPDEEARIGGRAYFAIDLGEAAREEPGIIGAMLATLMDDVRAGRLSPLPLRTFAMDRVNSAFQYMARGRHIGKIVVSQPPAADGLRFRADASYLLTGGLGGLGLRLAAWMVERGARHLTLMGRRPATEAARAALGELEAHGARISLAQGDVSRAADVERILADIDASGPALRGIIHGAGVLDDGVLLQQTWPRFATVFGPKVDGAWLLHERTRLLPLDFFVLLSSIASLLGSAGQANHAGANAFLDALAHHRAAQGLPALSVNWGPWGEIGAAADRDVIARVEARGISPIPPGAALEALERLMVQAAPQVGVVAIDWRRYLGDLSGGAPAMLADLARASSEVERPRTAPAESPTVDIGERLRRAPTGNRRAIVLEEVREQIARGLGLDAATVGEGQPFSELGLDSLLAVELRTRLARHLGLERSLPATTLFDYPTLQALADYLIGDVLHLADGAGPSLPASGPSPEPTAALDSMSDEEAELLLLKELEELRSRDPR
jgi:acyl transferase domain-containing protein/ubiquinone/menaquinone biosynthesis C-methylase UbiE/acyl carrier protein